MDLIYLKSRSNNKPDLVDTTSSNTTVYIRKNIEEKIITDENSGKETIQYEYDEAKLTKEQYEIYLNDTAIMKTRADIDYIALITNIDL